MLKSTAMVLPRVTSLARRRGRGLGGGGFAGWGGRGRPGADCRGRRTRPNPNGPAVTLGSTMTHTMHSMIQKVATPMVILVNRSPALVPKRFDRPCRPRRRPGRRLCRAGSTPARSGTRPSGNNSRHQQSLMPYPLYNSLANSLSTRRRSPGTGRPSGWRRPPRRRRYRAAAAARRHCPASRSPRTGCERFGQPLHYIAAGMILRRSRWTSSAWAGVATLPVPMAQTGS